MDLEAVSKSFFIGHDRTIDLLELIPSGDEGEAEIVGIFIASIGELAQRWDMSEREAIKNVARVIPKE
jgi:hypothetical protein